MRVDPAPQGAGCKAKKQKTAIKSNQKGSFWSLFCFCMLCRIWVIPGIKEVAKQNFQPFAIRSKCTAFGLSALSSGTGVVAAREQ